MPILLAALAGLVGGAALRPVVVALAVPSGHPSCVACSGCGPASVPARNGQALGVFSPSGRCAAGRHQLCPPWLPEAATSAAFVAVAAGGASGWYAAAQYWMALLGAALLLIDSAVHRLPDALTLPATVGTLVLLIFAADAGESGSLPRAVAVAAAGGVLFFGFALGGMGLGDAKFAVPLGALLGWHSWTAALLGLVLSYVLGATAAVILLLRGHHRTSPLPFGPFLLLGTLASEVLVGG